MIDNFAIALTHALLMLTAWLLLKRPDLDREGTPRGWRGRNDPGA